MRPTTGQINDGIAFLDNGLLDAAGVGSTYVLRGDEIAIVETGTSRCAPQVLAGLRELGVEPADVRHIVLTHIHMDHAGGTGTLLPHMPEATVHIHSRTARYLSEPAELLVSAQRALGPLFPLHGGMDPVPAERISPAEELDLDLGRGLRLQAIPTPGHSGDHLAYLEAGSGCLFTGDAVGISVAAAQYDGPVTPPPGYNVAAQRETFTKLLGHDWATLLFSHFGPSARSPRAEITLLQERFEQLYDLVQRQLSAGAVDHAAIANALYPGDPGSAQHAAIVVGWINMSVDGLVLALERAARKAQSG
jgi:glyoxylase-like metal-dependent hydrolase (beta-lactamase superfamily II)